MSLLAGVILIRFAIFVFLDGQRHHLDIPAGIYLTYMSNF